VDFLTQLFDTSDFPARWNCGAGWQATPWYGWLHILSDLGIWSAYLAIPCVLGYFLLRRKDIPFRTIFLLFGAFILACGTTHLMEALIFWWPAYRLAGVIKLFTALVSWGTVVALIPVVPKVLAMRSPEELEREIRERTAELTKANEILQAEVRDRQRAEGEITRLNRELQSRADELQTILNIVPIGVAIAHDPQCRCITHNPYMSEILNVPAWVNASLTAPQDERPTNFTNYRGGQEVPTSELPMQVACTGVEVRDVELDLVCQGRVPRKMLYHARPLFDRQGKVRGSVGVCLDITARKQAEEALQQSEQRFARFMQHLPGLAWIKDLQGRYVFANDSAARVFRTPRAELCGKTDDEIFPPETAAQFKENDRRALESGAGLSLIETLEHDGVLRSSLVNKFTMMGSDSQTVLIGGIAIDITDRLQAEEALKEADRRKNEFLATLAHELRNPLAPIRNSLQILKMPRLDAATAERSREMMERQVHHLVRLVDDLLDVSRVMRGKIELRRERVELSTVVARAVETVQPLIEAHGHELTVQLSPESLPLDADPVRLAQVVGNLLTNAAKYTEANGRIRLTAQREGGEAVLRVRDTGIGIAPNMLPHVFELFVQADHAATRSQGGLGIGLTLVKNLVEMHHGTVEAHSNGLGEGCEFVIRLPLMPQEERQRVEKDSGEAPHEPAHSSGHRLLVVDDNPDAADSLAMLLRLQGHEVRVAHDGPAALQIAAASRPDLVFLDIGMPGMDGYEVARRLRQTPGLEKVVLAALTGWGQQEDRRRTAEAGFDHHLVKPVEPKTLEGLLAELQMPKG